MEIEIRALTQEVRNLVSALERAERAKEMEKIISRGDKKDMFTEAWEEAKPLIHNNFESWRDYLYKYALVLITVLGFVMTLIASKWVGQLHIGLVAFGIICISLAILISFISIFITLYLERKFTAADMAFTQCMQVDFHRKDGQDDGKRNPMRAIEKYLEGVIEQREKELAGLNQRLIEEKLTYVDRMKLEWEIADLSAGIKGDRRTKALMKYVGVQYTTYEVARLIVTLIVLCLSLAGLVTIIFTLLNSYSNLSFQIQQTIENRNQEFLIPGSERSHL